MYYFDRTAVTEYCSLALYLVHECSPVTAMTAVNRLEGRSLVRKVCWHLCPDDQEEMF